MSAAQGRLLLALVATLAFGAFNVETALALPEGRHYEMVSPAYKGGYGTESIRAVAPGGERVVFASLGAFEGIDDDVLVKRYIASRGASGWSTSPVDLPSTVSPSGETDDFSPSLGVTLASALSGPATNIGSADQVKREASLMLHNNEQRDTLANWETFGGLVLKSLKNEPVELSDEGASVDFCRVVVGDSVVVDSEGEGLLLPESESDGGTRGRQLYVLSSGCGGEVPSLQLLGLNNRGTPITPNCLIYTGVEGGHVSVDGSEIFFSTAQTGLCPGVTGPTANQQLFVRLGGERTLEVSRPLAGECTEVPCLPEAATRPPATFSGMSEDGSRVFFTTTAALTGEDQDKSNDLYMASIGCQAVNPGCGAAERVVTGLVQVSHDPTVGQAAEVDGVVDVAPDGSHVYFVARGDLLSSSVQASLEGGGRSVPRVGAENLYVYDSLTQTMGFVADLCSGPKLSGGVTDGSCPADLVGGSYASRNDAALWSGKGDRQEESMNVCVLPNASECVGERETGRYLVFTSYGRLVHSDVDNAKDVYRYDAQTGELVEISHGENGYDTNGNASEPTSGSQSSTIDDATIAFNSDKNKTSYEQHELPMRDVSEDGSRIVFTTAEPLSVDVTNGVVNAYEWHGGPGLGEGRVSLVSSGSDARPVSDVVMSSSGRDVFFQTVQSLLPQDTDVAADIYDARLGEGFPVLQVKPQRCAGDACQGSLTNPAPLLVPGSVVQAPGQNFASPPGKPKTKRRPKTPSRHKGKHRARRAVHRGRSAKRGRGRS